MKTELKWKRGCKICTHTYYLPYVEPGKYRKLFRKIFKTKKKFRGKCPICGSSRVITNGPIRREIKQTSPTI